MIRMTATAIAVAFIVFSCRGGLAEADALNIDETPLQVVTDMFALDSQNGKISMRMESKLMQKFDNDSTSYDYFPNGFAIYTYLEDGKMEAMIFADKAKHITEKRFSDPEVWQAFGNVVIHNVIKHQTIKTDTLYWDKGKNEIWTDCYVVMDSPDGLIQGYGMRSDDRARHAVLYRAFDGYTLTQKDTTVILVDSVNFIGPFIKK